MKWSLGISNFLEEISNLSHSVLFLYFFALISEEDFLISPCCSLKLCIQMGISFLFSFAFHFSSFLILLLQRADRLKISHRKLTNLITWTTALSNSMKLWAIPCRATQDGQVMVEGSEKMWSTGEGNGKPLQYSCLENPMNSIKWQHRHFRNQWTKMDWNGWI